MLNDYKEVGLKCANELTETSSDNWCSYYSATEIFEEAGENEEAKGAYLRAKKFVEDQNSKFLIQQRADRLE